MMQLPITILIADNQRVEIYQKINEDNTHTMVALAGQSGQSPTKQICQGPFERVEQLLAIVGEVAASLTASGYITLEADAGQWQLMAQRINRDQERVRRDHQGNYRFDPKNVFPDH